LLPVYADRQSPGTNTDAACKIAQEFICRPVAIVVLSVTHLENGRSWDAVADEFTVDAGQGRPDTARTQSHGTWTIGIDGALVQIPVTVIVQSIAAFFDGQTRALSADDALFATHGQSLDSATAQTDHTRRTETGHLLVGLAITIIIEAVTDFVLSALEWIARGGITPLAVFHCMPTNPETTHHAAEALVGVSITVVVQSIADFDPGLTGLERTDTYAIIATGRPRNPTLTHPDRTSIVFRESLFVGGTVTIIVDAVAELRHRNARNGITCQPAVLAAPCALSSTCTDPGTAGIVVAKGEFIEVTVTVVIEPITQFSD